MCSGRLKILIIYFKFIKNFTKLQKKCIHYIIVNVLKNLKKTINIFNRPEHIILKLLKEQPFRMEHHIY
jgi:aspartyl/asparaginyl-tRNA synthetase